MKKYLALKLLPYAMPYIIIALEYIARQTSTSIDDKMVAEFKKYNKTIISLTKTM